VRGFPFKLVHWAQHRDFSFKYGVSSLQHIPSTFFHYPGQVILMAKGRFWVGAAVGFILMVLIGGALPVLGPVIGGFVAGLIAKGGLWNGAKAGFTAGILGALVVIIIGLVIGTLAMGLFGFLLVLGIGAILIATALYYAVLGLVGGAIGGLISK
jgi:hypothetical protein